jgi:hypothetical protein
MRPKSPVKFRNERQHPFEPPIGGFIRRAPRCRVQCLGRVSTRRANPSFRSARE